MIKGNIVTKVSTHGILSMYGWDFGMGFSDVGFWAVGVCPGFPVLLCKVI